MKTTQETLTEWGLEIVQLGPEFVKVVQHGCTINAYNDLASAEAYVDHYIAEVEASEEEKTEEEEAEDTTQQDLFDDIIANLDSLDVETLQTIARLIAER